MDAGARVAVYWDFENVHASVLDEIQGDGAYQRQHFKPQDRVVDLDPVIDYAAGFGSVVVNRAYANWQWLAKYRGVLQSQAVDLVQMFPLSGLKNGADIRLALDVMEDLHQHDHITHVVVVAGDSDYVALAQKCRKLGRQFIGVGMPKTNALFKAACDEFKYYRAIVSALSAGDDPLTEANPVYELDDAADLLLRALRGLAVGAESPWVLKAAVRPMLVRLDSTFDEANYGFTSLNQLLAALDGSIVQRPGEHDRELAPRAALGAEEDTDPSTPASIDIAIDPVDRALRRVQLRLPVDRSLLWRTGPLLIDVFRSRPDGIAASLQDVVRELHARLRVEDESVTEQDVKRLKNIYVKIGAFELLGPEVGVRLRIVDEPALADRMVQGLLERIRSQAPDLLDDEATLIKGLCGGERPPQLVAEIARITR